MHEGQRLGRYHLGMRIGEGGVGVVYVGLDDEGRAYAVKILKPHVAGDPEARNRLAREVATLQRLRHPAIAEVVDADATGPMPYLVTRYIPAPSLHQQVHQRGPLGTSDLVRLGNGMGQALAAIHRAGVVHRDLKPANVLMAADPVLIDFGLAHVLDDTRLTRTGMVMGTPGYLCPELIAGAPVHTSADWWAWAATMAFAATGRAPFGGGRADIVLDRVRRGDADLAGVPVALVDTLRRGLLPEPDQRPEPAELRVALLDLDAAAPQDALTQALTTRTDQLASADLATAFVDLRGSLPAVREPAAARAWRTPADGVPLPSPVSPRSTTGIQSNASATAATFSPATAPADATVANPVAATLRTAAAPATAPVSSSLAPSASSSHGGPGSQYGRTPPPSPAPYGRYPGHTDPAATGPARTGDSHSALTAGPHARRWNILATVAALCLLAGHIPVVTIGISILIGVLARTVAMLQDSLYRRRQERGSARTDPLVVTLGSPWHLLRGGLHTVAAAVPALVVGGAVAYLVAFMAGAGEIGAAVPALSGPHLAVGAAAAYFVAWWGPGGVTLRRGSRWMARAMSPGLTGRRAYLAVTTLVAASAAILLWRSGADPASVDWFPWPRQPLR